MKKLINVFPVFFTLLFCVSFLLPISPSFSQDIHFSQFSQVHSLTNPALTGIAHDFRAYVIYRDQWRGVTVPYKTYGASIENKFKTSREKGIRKFFSSLGVGLSFYGDKAGDGNMGESQVNLSFSSKIPINDNNSLAGGLQASVVQRTLDFSKLIFTDQYNGNSYDPTIISGENVGAQNFIFPDFAGGINWTTESDQSSMSKSNYFKMNTGFSVYHINNPELKFLSGSNARLNPKFVVHGDFLLVAHGTGIVFIPSYLLEFQGSSKEVILGILFKYYLKESSKYTGFIKQSAFGLGGALRNKDAFIFSAIFETGQYAFGFSYDLNISKLITVSEGRGGAEIFIRFVTPNPFLINSPKKRYNLN